MDLIRDVALATEKHRGGHAWGLTWIDSNGRLRMHKQPGRLAECPHVFDSLAGASMVVGHARYATNGDCRFNINQHPHPCDGGWLCHNGTIPFHRALASYWDVPTSSFCDSEVLAGLVEIAPRAALADRLAWAMEVARQASPQAALGLWTRPVRMLIARAGKPLHWTRCKNGDLYLASLAGHLPGKPEPFRDNTVFVIGANGRISPAERGVIYGGETTTTTGTTAEYNHSRQGPAAREGATGASSPGPRGPKRKRANQEGPGLFPGH